MNQSLLAMHSRPHVSSQPELTPSTSTDSVSSRREDALSRHALQRDVDVEMNLVEKTLRWIAVYKKRQIRGDMRDFPEDAKAHIDRNIQFYGSLEKFEGDLELYENKLKKDKKMWDELLGAGPTIGGN